MSCSDKKEEESEIEKDQVDTFVENDSYGSVNEDKNSLEHIEGELIRKKSRFQIFHQEEEEEEEEEEDDEEEEEDDEDEEEKTSLEKLAKNSFKDKERRKHREEKERESYEESEDSTNYDNISYNKSRNHKDYLEEESVSFVKKGASNRHYSEEESNSEVEESSNIFMQHGNINSRPNLQQIQENKQAWKLQDWKNLVPFSKLQQIHIPKEEESSEEQKYGQSSNPDVLFELQYIVFEQLMRGEYFGYLKFKIIEEMRHTLIPELFPVEWREILSNLFRPNNIKRPDNIKRLQKVTKQTKQSTNTKKKQLPKPKPSKKRKRSEFLEDNRSEFFKMPNMDKDIWPKYIGSFQTCPSLYSVAVMKRFKIKKSQVSNSSRLISQLELGESLSFSAPFVEESRGFNKSIKQQLGTVSTFIQKDGSLEKFGELNHYLNEIWSFLIQKKLITLKGKVVQFQKSTNDINRPRFNMNIIVDVFLNKELIENKEQEKSEEFFTKEEKQSRKVYDSDEDEEKKNTGDKEISKSQKDKLKKEKKQTDFRKLSIAEKQYIWDESQKQHLKEALLLLVAFMKLQVISPALVKQKKKNKFKLLTDIIYRRRNPFRRDDQIKIVVKSPEIEQYYQKASFLNDPGSCFRLYQEIEELKKNGVTDEDLIHNIKFPEEYNTCEGFYAANQRNENEEQLDSDVEVAHNARQKRQEIASLIEMAAQPAEYVANSKSEDNQAESWNNKFAMTHESKFYVLTPTPKTMTTQLFIYQQQGLSWLLYREGKISKAQLFQDAPELLQEDRELSPFYQEILLPDGYKLYLNVLSGHVSPNFVKAKHTFGGILGDMMGLGKTLMSLALILSDLEEQRKKQAYGTLIVLPLQLIAQWERQITLHTHPNTVKVWNYHRRNAKEKQLLDSDIVLCTYDVLSSKFKRQKSSCPLFQKTWHRIILDEAHKIKNKDSFFAKSAQALKSDYRWCMTGTPIVNHLDDLFSLLRFLRVETFGEWIWWNAHMKINDQSPQESADIFDLLHQVISPIILRRTKDTTDKSGKEILSLPQKFIHKIEVDLVPSEKRLYDIIHSKSEAIFNHLNEAGQIKQKYIHIFQIISKLRQFCVHPSLVFADIDEDKLNNIESFQSKIDLFLQKNLEGSSNNNNANDKDNESQRNSVSASYKAEVIKQIQEGKFSTCQVCLEDINKHSLSKCLHVLCSDCFKKSIRKFGTCPLCRKNLTLEDIMDINLDAAAHEADSLELASYNNRKKLTGSKMQKIIELIQTIQDRHEKVVVFSQWLGALDILEQHLAERNITFQRLDGKVNRENREKILQNFEKKQSEENEQNNITVLLASMKSTCVGLNLIAANNVILCDSWWNPAIEDQAMERVHRIGQDKDVNVWRVVCKHTVEERVLQLHEEKRRLISDALACTESGRQESAINDIRFLFAQPE